MPDEALAAVMRIRAADAAASVHDRRDLDYSIRSLRIVEQLLEEARAGPELDDETARALAMAWGGYVGEVFRRCWGGEWLFPEAGPFRRKICLVVRDSSVGTATREITLFPVERAYKQLVNGLEDGIWSYACAVESRLSRRAE